MAAPSTSELWKKRWVEIRELLARGMTPQQVAEDLGLKVRTIGRQAHEFGYRDLASQFDKASGRVYGPRTNSRLRVRKR